MKPVQPSRTDGSAATTLRVVVSARSLRPEAGLALLHNVLIDSDSGRDDVVNRGELSLDHVLVYANGRTEVVDSGTPVAAASALYAAGTLFYACLTGAEPAVDAQQGALGRTVPLEPLPEPLRPLVERALARDAQDRYPDVGAFAADVERVAADAYGEGWLECGIQLLRDAAGIAIDSESAVTREDAGAVPWHRRKRNRRSAVALLAAAALVVALVVLLPGSSGPSFVRAPFLQAISALAKAPGVRYQDHDQFTGYYDVTVTATGERFGFTGQTPNFSGKDDQALVTVGGRDYLDPKNDRSISGWLYEPQEDQAHMAPVLAIYQTPASLAAALTKAMNEQPVLPVVGDKAAASVTVDGIPAWKADTTEGYIFVSRTTPSRLLRWEPPGVPYDESEASALAADPTASLPSAAPAQPAASQTDSLGMDVTAITNATQLYDTLIQDTKGLATATAGDAVEILQTDDGSSNVLCSSTGCRVNVAFSGPVFNSTSAQYALSSVYVDVTVGSITTGGEQVGGCTSGPRPFKLTSATLTGKLTCDNPAGGPIFDRVNARNQAEANAEAGTSEFWDYASDINLDVYVLTSGDIDRLVAKEQRELRSFS